MTQIEKTHKLSKDLKPLKFDISKLRTLPNYAAYRGVHLTTVHRWAKNKELNSVKIDGVRFAIVE